MLCFYKCCDFLPYFLNFVHLSYIVIRVFCCFWFLIYCIINVKMTVLTVIFKYLWNCVLFYLFVIE